MLYPQTNAYRQVMPLPEFWMFRLDPQDAGQQEGWQAGFSEGRPISVPASWNDQFEEGRDYLGPAWYQITFDMPWGWHGKRIMLRFGSVNYLATVWLNGQCLGTHEGGHLPFEFELTELIKSSKNALVLRVDGSLAFDRVPPGNVVGTPVDFFPSHAGNYPQAQFDFFPYCGIQRPVFLYATPFDHIKDITVQTEIYGQDGLVKVSVVGAGGTYDKVRFDLSGHGQHLTGEALHLGDKTQIELNVSQAALWSPATPNLYDLRIELIQNDTVMDAYTIKTGLRTICMEGNQFFLNGDPIYLRGFGRHEDFPVVGRGYLPALIIKDYSLMAWMGANSFRTSHYPYSEPMLDLAYQLGFLVIDETPAVGLYFREDGLEKRHQLCHQALREMIARDKNHPSVIAWSLANEPHSAPPHARPFFEGLYQEAKRLDATRPVTLVSFLGEQEEAFGFCDLVCLNRYWGWYAQGGDLDAGLALLSAELDALHGKFGKPILLTEFGADALPGHHAQPPEMFSEEYQAELLVRYIRLLREKPYMVGEHIWNLCDFKTSQGITRVGAFNYKGIFTRDRRPKLAAHQVRALWQELNP
ncbi:MAG: beta-glucuronidase [Anaerolineales bacterium]|nr:beta-glucuronidase [Anaerolineales bacterium]